MQNLAHDIVPKDKFILLIDNRSDQRLIKICDHRKFNWRKTLINLEGIISYPYYTQLQVGNNKLTPVQWDFEQQIEDEQNDVVDQANNNKQIFTIEEAQKLQAQDIQKMKKELKPSEIISGLVQNNEQFSKRTQYSKLKYLKKKERKYMFKIHAQPVTLENVHNYYFKQEHKAIGSIRWDILGLFLLYSSPFKRVLLAEQSKGIILSSVLQRGAKSICVANIEKKSMKNFPIVEQLNISKSQQQKVSFSSWSDITSNTNQKFDNFLVMGNYNFCELITSVEGQLIEGAIISMFCQSQLPLQQAARLMKQKKYLNVRLQDSWCREYQVLHNRTHPLMYMDSSSGYLLTAFKVS